jgi:hypothetical protein
VNAFRSITPYDSEGYQVANSLRLTRQSAPASRARVRAAIMVYAAEFPDGGNYASPDADAASGILARTAPCPRARTAQES